MNKISVFEHPEFGRIRTLDIDGKIWFCASDIASALGYANPRDAVARHCKPMGVAIYDTPTRSAVQKIKYINEGNVYRLIAGSKLPSAEKFESWIFDELVPETLKNGGYLLGKKGETDNELLARAVLLAQKRIKERDSRISALEKENNYAILKLKLQAPKVQHLHNHTDSQRIGNDCRHAEQAAPMGRHPVPPIRPVATQSSLPESRLYGNPNPCMGKPYRRNRNGYVDRLDGKGPVIHTLSFRVLSAITGIVRL